MQINKDKLARIISTVFVPPSFSIIVFTLLAFYLETESTQRYITIFVALIFGFISPIVLFVYYRKKGKIIDLDASIKEERTVPMSISVIFFTVGLIMFIAFDLNIVSIAYWFCYISNTLIAIIINKNWKISAHTMGAAGPLAAVTFLFGPIALVFLIIVVLVGWSRIQLKCHSIGEVIAGGIFAFISTYIQIYLIVSYFCT
ncbi:MAG: phosphatase PAP2 family protein [Bacteroidetes bacterium]|nr:phosphatase PAP2 family protein [Bacteroidota bacterium]